MKLAIVAVGHRQPDWISAGCSEYLKRLPPEMAARMIEIKPEPRGSKAGNNCSPPNAAASTRHCPPVSV